MTTQLRDGINDTKPPPKPDSKPNKNKGVVDRAEDVLGLDLQIVEQHNFLNQQIE